MDRRDPALTAESKPLRRPLGARGPIVAAGSRAFVFAAAGLCALQAPTALASPEAAVDVDEPAEGERDPDAAEELFREAAELMAEGAWREACPRFEKSWALDPARGALLGVAECHERAGELASAWAAYHQLKAEALTSGDRDRAEIAADRIEAIEPRLPRLVIFAEGDEEHAFAAGDDFEIRRSGEPISETQIGAPIAVDPGAHEIEARLPGTRPWRRRIEVGAGETETIEIPLAELVSKAEPPRAETRDLDSAALESRPARYEREGGRAQRWLGKSAVSGGALSAAAGVGFAVRWYRQHRRFDELCPEGACDPDDEDGPRARRHAQGASTLATAFIGVGLVAMTGGVVLWATAPSPSPSPESPRGVGIAPYANPESLGATLKARF